MKYYRDNWPEAFKASEGYNNPCFASLVPKPMPILSDDATSTPKDKLEILQDSDEWSAIPGYPGPALPATDEIYYDFIINDMMAKTATGQLSAEDSVKWATQQMRGHLQKVGRQGLTPMPGPRVRTRSGCRVMGRRLKGVEQIMRRRGMAERAFALISGRFNGCGIDEGHRQEIR